MVPGGFGSRGVEGKIKAAEYCIKNNKPYLDHYINKHENVPLWVIMNNLDLGQAFRFYDYLPESIRFPIARRFQALYAETHFVPKRITHKDLKNAFDHIKDFRNRCAHDEQLHCARIDKSGSTKFKDVFQSQMHYSN